MEWIQNDDDDAISQNDDEPPILRAVYRLSPHQKTSDPSDESMGTTSSALNACAAETGVGLCCSHHDQEYAVKSDVKSDARRASAAFTLTESQDMGLGTSKSLSTWERHMCCAPREEVSGPGMAPVINASTLSDKMPAHCTWEMLEQRYAQLLEHQYTRRPLRLDVADGCAESTADASAQQVPLPVRASMP